MSTVIRAISFKCVDESGIDWSGSDEPYWIFTAVREDGTINTSKSKVFGDTDSGETKRFRSGPSGAGENIIWPGPGAVNGAPGSAIVSVQLWDQDQGNAEDIRAKTEAAFKAAAAGVFVPGFQWLAFASLVPEIVRNHIVVLLGDDLMGSTTVTINERRLRREFPNGGSRPERPIRLSGRSGDLPFEVAGGPDYDLNLELEYIP